MFWGGGGGKLTGLHSGFLLWGTRGKNRFSGVPGGGKLTCQSHTINLKGDKYLSLGGGGGGQLALPHQMQHCKDIKTSSAAAERLYSNSPQPTLNQITRANIQIMSFNMIVILVATCFLSNIEAAPLSLHDQFQVALQQIAELKGNGTFESCCNVSSIQPYH